MSNSERNLFKDDRLYAQFEERGYAIVPLFDAGELKELEALFYQYFPEVPPAFFSSSYLSDFDRKKEISQKIEALMVPKLEKHFKDFRSIGAAFLSKAPDHHSELPMHQDWTIVDESQFLAANIWTPITKPSTENGTLEVLPGSHKTFRALRAPTLPFSGSNLRAEMKKHLVPLYVQAGEAVVLDQALVHYSNQNRSEQARLAFTTGVISKEAPLFFHYWDKDSRELEKFAMDDDFLFRWETFHQDIFKRPTFGESLSKTAFEPEVFTEERLYQTMGVERPAEEIPAATQEPSNASQSSRKSFFQRLFSR